MKTANIIFPHQLFKNSPLIENGHPAWIIEEYLFFKQYNFHKQKIAFHRSTMKSYTSFLQTKGIEIHYVNSFEKAADIRLLIKELAAKNYTSIHYIDPADNWLERRINKSAGENNISLKKYYSPSFLNTGGELKGFFKESKKKFFQSSGS